MLPRGWQGGNGIQHGSVPGRGGEGVTMNNIFYIIGVVVVVLVILGYFGFR
jgi:hypothetical protein